jgi:hypothetical protein
LQRHDPLGTGEAGYAGEEPDSYLRSQRLIGLYLGFGGFAAGIGIRGHGCTLSAQCPRRPLERGETMTL